MFVKEQEIEENSSEAADPWRIKHEEQAGWCLF